MKILDILKEEVSPMIAYRQLSPLQIGLLKKIVDHRFDYDIASQASQDAVDRLVDLGLVNGMSLEATETGEEALRLAVKYGSTERRQLDQSKRQELSRSSMSDDDINEPDFDVELD